MMPSVSVVVHLSDTDRAQLEGLLYEFDRSWSQHALAARVAQLPPGDSVYRQAALVELVKIDLERQWQAGNRHTVDVYLRQFPELGSLETVSTEILEAEYEARQRFGTPAEVQDFERRFPAFSAASASGAGLSSVPNLADRPAEASVDTSRTGSAADTGVQAAGQLTTLPEQFGRYRILKRLGSGGMGTVYLAHDGELDRKVALKVPKSDHADGPAWIHRFYQEARAAAALHHRNICSIFDIGEVDGMHYISMAWIEGESLADWTRNKRQISGREAASIIYKLALALQEAHARGVIHRDLKPANVMMDHEREPVITDFGLARQLDKDGQSRLTHPGMIMGTPAYMSPEQISGEIERVQAPSDIYSLGVILYELLTGELPFSGTVSAVIGKKLSHDSPRSASVRGNVHPALDSICAKMLARRVDDRYQSMKQVADELGRYLAAEETAGARRQLAWLKRSSLRLRQLAGAAGRYRGRTIAASAGVLALLAAVVLLLTPYGTLQIETNDPKVRVTLDGRQLKIEDLQQPRRVRAGEHEFQVAVAGQAFPFSGTIELSGSPGQRRLSVELDGVAIQSNRFTVLRGKNHVLTIAMAPSVPPPPGGRVWGVVAARQKASGQFAFSAHDGRQWDVYTYAPATGRWTNVTRTPEGNELHPRFSPDGRQIAFQSNRDGSGLGNSAYDVYVLERGGIRRLTERIGWAGSGLAWSPDGTELLASVEQWKDGDPLPEWTNWQEMWRVPVVAGKPTRVADLSQPQTFYQLPDWHPRNGVVLAVFNAPYSQKDLFVTRLAAGEKPSRLTDTGPDNADPRWSPDGQWLWFASERSSPAPAPGSPGIYRLFVMRPDGSGLQARFHEATEDRSPVPIEDGLRVAFVRSPKTGPRLMIADCEGSVAQTLVDLSWFEEVRSLDWTAWDGPEEGSQGLP